LSESEFCAKNAESQIDCQIREVVKKLIDFKVINYE